jgi:predicted outer membrane repeat protein
MPVNKSVDIIGPADSDLAPTAVIDCGFAGSAINFTHTALSDPSAGSTISISNIAIINGFARYEPDPTHPLTVGGVAIHVGRRCSLLVTNCYFANHAAVGINPSLFDSYIRGGGAVFVDLSAGNTVQVLKSSFVNCSVLSPGGPFGGGMLIRLSGAEREQERSRAAGALAVNLVSVSIEDCTFTKCGASFGGGLAICSDNGGAIGESVDLLVAASTFTECMAKGGGGGGAGVAFVFNSVVTDSRLVVQECEFSRNVGGDMGGGGIAVAAKAAMLDSTVTVTRCRFVTNRAISGGSGATVSLMGMLSNVTVATHLSQFLNNTSPGGNGCGLNINFAKNGDGGSVTDSKILVNDCTFANNTLTGSGTVGAGLSVWFQTDVHMSAVVVTRCHFRDNRAFLGDGGGVSVRTSFPAAELSVSFRACVFMQNVAQGGDRNGGGGGAFSMRCSSTAKALVVYITGCTFDSNTVKTGSGGAIFVETEVFANTLLHIINSTLQRNTAPRYGGGVYMSQVPANEPTNLQFELTKHGGTWGAPCFVPQNGSIGAFREWGYHASLWIESSLLALNKATAGVTARVTGGNLNTQTASDTIAAPFSAGSGGAVAISNVNATISSTIISNNFADKSAAAVAMLPGTARLRIDGHTHMHSNQVAQHQLGSVIHSTSAGALEFAGNSLLEFGDGRLAPTRGERSGEGSGVRCHTIADGA